MSAQLVDVVTGVDTPYEIAFNRNDLYVIEGGAGKIIKIDVTTSTPVAEDFLTGLNGITAIALNGNDLYYASIPGIFKVDITDNSQTLVEIVSPDDLDSSVGAMEIYNNQLYFSAIVNNNNGIHRTDLTGGASIEQLISVGFSSNGLAFIGSTLYASIEFEGKVIYLDVADTNPVATDFMTGLNGPRGIRFIDDYLYVAEAFGGQLSRIDSTLSTPEIEVIATDLDFLYGLASNSTDLYIAEHSNDKISKLDTNTLTVEEFESQYNVALFPNPSVNEISISGLNHETSYSILNMQGSIVSTGTIKPTNSKISTQGLSQGIYFLNLDNNTTLKFIKK